MPAGDHHEPTAKQTLRLRQRARQAPEDLSDLALSTFHACPSCCRLVKNFEPCQDCRPPDLEAYATRRDPDRGPVYTRGTPGRGN